MRLQAIPAITTAAARNQSGRFAPSLVKRSTTAIAVAPAYAAWPEGNEELCAFDQRPGGRGRSTSVLIVFEASGVSASVRANAMSAGQRRATSSARPISGERQGAPEASAEGIEDEGDMREERRFDVAHQLRPAAVERERAGRDEQCAEQHESEEQARPAHCPPRVDEELLPAVGPGQHSVVRGPSRP